MMEAPKPPPLPLESRLRIQREALLADLASNTASLGRIKALVSPVPELEWATYAPDPATSQPAPGAAPVLETPADPAPERWLHPSDVLRNLKHAGTRFPTGIRSIDEATRGGIQRGRVVTIVGQPGAGKTGLALQIAARIADSDPAGVFVALYLDDEGTESGVIRLAQHGGGSRDLIEAANPEAIESAAVRLQTRQNLLCYNGELRASNLSDFLEVSALEAAGRVEILVIDSAQVITTGSAGPAKDRRLTVAEVAETVRKRTRLQGAITLLLSQSNRASYRSKKGDENSDPISAGAESAALEFNADVLVFMATAGQDVSTVVIPKNRLGPRIKAPFEISWNRATATFSQDDSETGSAEHDAMIREEKRVQLLASKAYATMRNHPEGLSGKAVCELSGLSGAGWKVARPYLDKVHKLRSETRPGKGGGTLWFAVDAGMVPD